LSDTSKHYSLVNELNNQHQAAKHFKKGKLKKEINFLITNFGRKLNQFPAQIFKV